ncbi:phosphoribosyltransferase family protein [Arthrobacter sp. LAPM80]|uniref:ComF family protein n=1 Tax=Arthrobacter sp. LAPM80 TaxID=3141788 RepID=UPI00398BB900
MDADTGDSGGWDIPQPAAAHRARASTWWLRTLFWCESAWREFLNLVLPAECVACGREDHALCPACSTLLRRQTRMPFRSEGAADALMGVAGESHLPVVAAGEYRDVLAAAILAFKNHGRTELAAPLCRCLARALDEAMQQAGAPGVGPGPPGPLRLPDPPGPHIPHIRNPASGPLLLVPIPSTGNGWRRRGYDPVAMVLRSLVGEGRLPAGVVIAPLLGIRVTLPWRRRHQKGLGRSARRQNVRNTMRIRRNSVLEFRPSANLAGRSVVLVDDVLTTGSTLQEATKTLEKSGFQVQCAVVLAAARAPDGSQKNPAVERRAESFF